VSKRPDKLQAKIEAVEREIVYLKEKKLRLEIRLLEMRIRREREGKFLKSKVTEQEP
jgi:hypothetical protein